MGLASVRHKFEQKKRRKRRIRVTIFLTLIFLSGLTYLLTSPRFLIQDVAVVGMHKIPDGFILDEVNALHGRNIFTATSGGVQNSLSIHPYFHSMKLRRKLPSTILITVTEEESSINLLKRGVIHLLSASGKVLEIGGNRVPGALNLRDDEADPFLGEVLYKDSPEKERFLQEFFSLHSRNKSDVPLDALNITDLSQIVLRSKNIEIRLGRAVDTQKKLNQSINIISGGALSDRSGYVDVSLYPANPVVFLYDAKEEEGEE